MKFYCPYTGNGVVSNECLHECEEYKWGGVPPCKDFPENALIQLEIIGDQQQDACRRAWYFLREGNESKALEERIVPQPFLSTDIKDYIVEPGAGVADFINYIKENNIPIRRPPIHGRR
jgi:hypothetical protein